VAPNPAANGALRSAEASVAGAVEPVTGLLTLVDLAGSERNYETTQHDARATRESADINTSLQTLKECFRATINQDVELETFVEQDQDEVVWTRAVPKGYSAALKAAQATGDEQARAEATFIKLQRAALNKSQRPADIIKGLDNLRYGWRDHQVELDALAFGFRVARSSNDRKNSLALGATLLRNFPEASRSREILPEYRKILLAVLNPSNGLTMDQSIGLYWEYRDLGPEGAEGDAITLQIAQRLETAGLYERAAQLLQYQLENRAQDIAKGPISIKAAMLSIRAGQYDRALQMITDSEGPRYPADITYTRKKVAAVALTLLGRRPEALAALEEVPDGLAITAEILWQDQQWADLEATQALLLRRTGATSPVARTLIFRQALALSMQTKTAQIEDLRRRYRGAFAGQPDGAAFDLLTAPADGINPATIADAIKKLPSVSPAGAFGDLLSLAPPPKARPAN
jgi:hypothetical protein